MLRVIIFFLIKIHCSSQGIREHFHVSMISVRCSIIFLIDHDPWIRIFENAFVRKNQDHVSNTKDSSFWSQNNARNDAKFLKLCRVENHTWEIVYFIALTILTYWICINPWICIDTTRIIYLQKISDIQMKIRHITYIRTDDFMKIKKHD